MNALNTKLARYNMIEQQIRPWDVLDERVLELLAQLPREDFVPETYKTLAFSDMSIPLGQDQFMMSPKLEARILQALEIKDTDRIMEIGTGSGYLTACLAKLGNFVESVDIFEHFTTASQEKLNTQEISNVSLHTADAAGGWGEGEYDVIAITGSLPILHQEFHDKLAIGGRIFVIVGTPPIMQARIITRASQSGWYESNLFETSIGPLVGAAKPDAFTF